MQGDTHAFIVRIWPEALNSGGNLLTWRGSIEYVGRDKRLYFRDLSEAVHFIQERTGIKTRRPRSGWRRLLARIWHERV